MEQTNPPQQPAQLSTSSSMQSISSTASNDQAVNLPQPAEVPQPNANDQAAGAPPPAPPPPPSLSPPVVDEFDEPKCTVLYDFQGEP